MVPCRLVEEMETVVSADWLREDGRSKVCIFWGVVNSVSQKNWLSPLPTHLPQVTCRLMCAGTTALPCSLGSGFEMVSCRPGQPQSCFVAKDDLSVMT